MVRYTADWVLPIAGPVLQPGWVDVDGDLVVGVGEIDTAEPSGTKVVELGSRAVLPALVNAHTHLELSGLRNCVPPAPSMPAWVDQLLSRRAAVGPPDSGDIEQAVAEAQASGTGLFGDIGNTLEAMPVLVSSSVSARLFCEVLAFSDDRAVSVVGAAVEALCAVGETNNLRVGLAAHAPFSVGRAAFAALDQAIRTTIVGPRSIHLAESKEELEFLRTGGGPWRDLLERLERWDTSWVVPGCGPVEYLERLGWLTSELIVVHGVQLTDQELELLAARGTTLVTCPRSNVWTGVGYPPIERFIRSGVRLAIGTDSLASTPDLNLFAELELMRRLAPDVPARQLLECATVAGAEALGFADVFGTITPGRPASLISVNVPVGVDDVEEYLLSGIEPGQVLWFHQS